MSSEPISKQSEDAYDAQLAEYKALMEYRKGLSDALVTVSGRFTQWSMGLTGGALALSITYLEKLGADPSRGIVYLIGCWLCLALGIIAGLVSLFMSQASVQRQISNLDIHCQAKNRDPGALFAVAQNSARNWTLILSIANIVLFILGVAFFVMFVTFCPPGNKTARNDHARRFIPITTTSSSSAASSAASAASAASSAAAAASAASATTTS